jgi:hypothetical protein
VRTLEKSEQHLVVEVVQLLVVEFYHYFLEL